ncbi:MAG: GNAT family N-acetyltransferase [Maribacter sp.]|nr:GNAT family N-acetyltransferase [Maribacter sp.]
MTSRIIPFNPMYIKDFRDLNLAWLKRYFYVEPKDKELLENCKKSIIDKGGHIFFAEYNKQIVGCFSFIRLDDTTFELGKMAVDPMYQGHKIGQQLVLHALAFARKNNWEKLVLYSSTKLPTALYIYKKYGFKDVALEKELPYARSDIKMELELNK